MLGAKNKIDTAVLFELTSQLVAKNVELRRNLEYLQSKTELDSVKSKIIGEDQALIESELCRLRKENELLKIENHKHRLTSSEVTRLEKNYEEQLSINESTSSTIIQK